MYAGPRLPAAITDLSVGTDITGARLAVGGVGHGKGCLLPYGSSRSGNLQRNLPIAEGEPSLHAQTFGLSQLQTVYQCSHELNHCVNLQNSSGKRDLHDHLPTAEEQGSMHAFLPTVKECIVPGTVS